jgi:hypothetical protein
VRLALKVVMQNDGDFMEVILLYKRRTFLDRLRKEQKFSQ